VYRQPGTYARTRRRRPGRPPAFGTLAAIALGITLTAFAGQWYLDRAVNHVAGGWRESSCEEAYAAAGFEPPQEVADARCARRAADFAAVFTVRGPDFEDWLTEQHGLDTAALHHPPTAPDSSADQTLQWSPPDHAPALTRSQSGLSVTAYDTPEGDTRVRWLFSA
jgi:hypothetical protein